MQVRDLRLFAVFLAMALTLPLVVHAGPALEIGSHMPTLDARMKNVDDAMISFADVKGDKGTLVIFTCNHCPYVKAWEERTVATANKAMKAGYGVIAVNPNDPTEYQDDGFDSNKIRAKNAGMMYPYVVDEGSRLAQLFGATRTPEFFLFDANGILVYHGALDDNAQDVSAVSNNYLQIALDANMKGQAISTSMTKSVGCSIKYYK
jgi:peroxiredoxin